MKPGGGKDKGSAFERKVCKELSLWLSDQENENLFWRSAMSGGRSTVQFKKGTDNAVQAGDVSAIDVKGHTLIDKFVLECKCYKTLKLDSLMYGVPKDNTIVQFWNTLVEEASRNNKEPMLIAKENNKPMIIGLSLKGTDIFSGGDRWFLDYSLVEYRNRGLYLFFFETFLKNIDPSVLEIL